MKKNLLLITAFLAIAGTAMAETTPLEVGREVSKHVIERNDKIEALKKADKALETEKKENPVYDQAKHEVAGKVEKARIDAINTEIGNIVANGTVTKEKAEEIERKLDEERANLKFDEAIADNANAAKIEDLKALKKSVDEAIAYNKKRLELIKNADISSKADHKKLLNKTARDTAFDITPGSEITRVTVKTDENLVPSLLDKGTVGKVLADNGKGSYYAGYKKLKDSIEGKNGLRKAYNDAKEAHMNADAATKEAKKRALEKAEKDLKDKEEELAKFEVRANSVLSIAGTTIEKYYTLKSDKEKSAEAKAEKERVEKELNKYVKDVEGYARVAEKYVYGAGVDEITKKDIEDIKNNAPDAEQKFAEKVNGIIDDVITGASVRITENAINIENNKKAIAENKTAIAANEKAIARNAQDIKDLRKDHNRGMAQMAAMASVDFGNVKARTVKVGAGIGQHSSETAVAVGVAVTPTDALMVNAKWSTSASSIKKSTLGLGATYEFNF